MQDPFDLQRFVDAQNEIYVTALAELLAGRKHSHWMWFIFPQVAGLGHSPMSKRYAISGLSEAAAYLAHSVLGPRLIECCDALLSLEGITASAIFGSPDDMKLRSSMTLFALVPRAPEVFGNVLDKYFDALPDERTLHILKTG
jgi:uncharacterized protein (DUF1810 family)